MGAVRCSSTSSSGHRCRRRTANPTGVCSTPHGTAVAQPARVLGEASDARRVGHAVTAALRSSFPQVSFLVSHTGRLETTVEWSSGPEEPEVLARVVALFDPGFVVGSDGRTVRHGRLRGAQPMLILVRHLDGPWRNDFDRALARSALVGAA